MGRSTVEIWNAGGKALAILILLFSGVWPYTKQLITLFLWFATPRTVSVKKRGSILMWLDTLAKWSIVDIFVLIVTVAGFRVSVQRFVQYIMSLSLSDLCCGSSTDRYVSQSWHRPPR